jgi:hypothetical protein
MVQRIISLFMYDNLFNCLTGKVHGKDCWLDHNYTCSSVAKHIVA